MRARVCVFEPLSVASCHDVQAGFLRTFLIYFISGIGGNVIAAIFSPNQVWVGDMRVCPSVCVCVCVCECVCVWVRARVFVSVCLSVSLSLLNQQRPLRALFCGVASR